MSGTGVASYGDLLVTSLVVLAGVCVAAFVVVRLFGRFLATGRVRGAHLLDVVARVPLEPRRSLYVVEVAGKTLLVGTSEMGLSVLSELDGGEVRARVVERPTFGELVKQAWARRKGIDKASARDDSVRATAATGSTSHAVDHAMKPARVDSGQTGAASPSASDKRDDAAASVAGKREATDKRDAKRDDKRDDKRDAAASTVSSTSDKGDDSTTSQSDNRGES